MTNSDERIQPPPPPTWADNPAVEALHETANALQKLADISADRLSGLDEPIANGDAELPIRNIAAHIKFARYWNDRRDPYLRRAERRSCPSCSDSNGAAWFQTQDGYQYDRCPSCGMVYIPHVLPLAVWDDYFAALPQAREWLLSQMEVATGAVTQSQNRERFQKYLHALERRGGVAPGARILDVGTYTGAFLESATDQGFEAVGIEGLQEAVRFVNERHSGRRVHWMQGESFDAQPLGGTFDAVTMWETLEHTIAPRRVLECAQRALGANGCLALTVPNALNVQFSVLREFCFFAYGGYQGTGHLNLYTPTTLRATLQRSGFEVIHLESEYGTDWRQMAYYLRQEFERIYCYRNLLADGDFQREPGASLSIVLNWLSPALTRLENAFTAGPILFALARRI